MDKTDEKNIIMAYSTKIWAKCKCDYETGNFSVKKLWKKHGISTATIENKIAKEKWIKGRLKEKIEKSTEQMFVDAGMPKEKVLTLIVEGMTEPKKLIFEGKGDQMICTPEKDYKTASDYIKEYNKMTGGYAPEKKEITLPNVPTTLEVIIKNTVGE